MIVGLWLQDKEENGRFDSSLFTQRHFPEHMKYSWCCEFCEVLSFFVSFFFLLFLGGMSLKNQVIFHGRVYA